MSPTLPSDTAKPLVWTTIPKLAKILGLSPDMLRDMAEDGTLPVWQNPVSSRQRVRARYLISIQSLMPWLQQTMQLSAQQSTDVIDQLRQQ